MWTWTSVIPGNVPAVAGWRESLFAAAAAVRDSTYLARFDHASGPERNVVTLDCELSLHLQSHPAQDLGPDPRPLVRPRDAHLVDPAVRIEFDRSPRHGTWPFFIQR